MTGTRLRLLAYGLGAALLIAALFAWFGRPQLVEVIVKKVDRGLVQDTTANTRAGTIKACNRAGISPSIGGQIASLPVKVGDQVVPGQLLLELWNADLQAEVALASSQVKASAALGRQACVLAEVAARDTARLQTLRKRAWPPRRRLTRPVAMRAPRRQPVTPRAPTAKSARGASMSPARRWSAPG